MKKLKINTRRLVALAFMSAISVSLHYLESVIPPIVPIPGFRLGLSNIITLFVLYYYGGPSFIFVTAVKVIMVALISSGFGVTFMMSLFGSTLSCIISLLLYYLVKPSPYGLSVMSSLFHTIGQLVAFAIFFNNFYIFTYLTILGPMALLSGALMALLVSVLIQKIPQSFKAEEKLRR